jgi:hypothetical protein
MHHKWKENIDFVCKTDMGKYKGGTLSEKAYQYK